MGVNRQQLLAIGHLQDLQIALSPYEGQLVCCPPDCIAAARHKGVTQGLLCP